nr:unnamed protein product [Callosobruchus chinensis]
MQFKEGQID